MQQSVHAALQFRYGCLKTHRFQCYNGTNSRLHLQFLCRAKDVSCVVTQFMKTNNLFQSTLIATLTVVTCLVGGCFSDGMFSILRL